MSDLSPDRMRALVALWESLSSLRLSDRVVAFVRDRRARGDVAAYARPAHYVAAASGASTTAQSYVLELQRNAGQLVLCTVEHPSEGTASILATGLRVGGQQYVDSDAICDAWCDPEGTTEDPRDLPHPVVVGTGDTLSLDVTGTALLTTGLQMRGLHVDDVTAAVIRAAGELYVEGINKTFAAAAVMATTVHRLMKGAKSNTHLVAKETLGGDTARANVSILVKGDRILPKEGAVVPPRSLRKSGARLDVDFAPNDGVQLDCRYTSAGGAGTATLQLTLLGRRRYR